MKGQREREGEREREKEREGERERKRERERERTRAQRFSDESGEAEGANHCLFTLKKKFSEFSESFPSKISRDKQEASKREPCFIRLLMTLLGIMTSMKMPSEMSLPFPNEMAL